MKQSRHILVFFIGTDETFPVMLDHAMEEKTGCVFMRFLTGTECVAHFSARPDAVIISEPAEMNAEIIKRMKNRMPDLPVILLNDIEKDLHCAVESLKGNNRAEKSFHDHLEVVRSVF